jgi:hypothetical protein
MKTVVYYTTSRWWCWDLAAVVHGAAAAHPQFAPRSMETRSSVGEVSTPRSMRGPFFITRRTSNPVFASSCGSSRVCGRTAPCCTKRHHHSDARFEFFV